MIRILFLISILLQLSLFPFAAFAKSLPSLDCALGDEVTENEDIIEDKIIFVKNTPKLYLNCDSMEVAKGETIRAVWFDHIDQELDESTIEVTYQPTIHHPFIARFSTIMPRKGWPAGSYQVKLYMNGKYLNAIHFSVK